MGGKQLDLHRLFYPEGNVAHKHTNLLEVRQKRSQINMSELQRFGMYFVSVSEPMQLHLGSFLSRQSGPMSIAQHTAVR